jgi:hypothetical protein
MLANYRLAIPVLLALGACSAGNVFAEISSAGRLKLGYEVNSAQDDPVAKVITKAGTPQRGLEAGSVGEALQAEFTRPFSSWSSFGHIGWQIVSGIQPTAWRAEFYVTKGFATLTGDVEFGISIRRRF